MNMEQAWLLFRRTGMPEAYNLYRELRERRDREAARPPAAPQEDSPAPGGRR